MYLKGKTCREKVFLKKILEKIEVPLPNAVLPNAAMIVHICSRMGKNRF